MKAAVDADGHRPRLLVLASTYPRWAGDHEPGFVQELSKRLVGKFDVTVLCPRAPGAKPRELMDGVQVVRYRYAPSGLETLVNDGGIVTNLRQAKWKSMLVPGFLLAQAWAAWLLTRKQRFDVLHAHWLVPQGLIAAMLQSLPGRQLPYVVTSHGADLYALKGRVMDALKRFVLRRAVVATVVSSAMRDALGGIGADMSKVSVQPMGVDLANRFKPDAEVVRSGDEILFVGRLVEKKGLRYLIDAMPFILASRPSAFLTVVGFGPEEAESKLQVERMSLQAQVRFVGPVPQDQLPGLYRTAAVFVAPFVEAASGDREGLGLVAVEAAGCGCPLVISDLPAVHQVFPKGAGAALVPPGDVAMLAKAVQTVLDRPSQFQPPSRESLCADFDWEGRANQYATLLIGAIGGSGKSVR